MGELFARVVVPLAVEGMFTYRVPENLKIRAKVGSRALVDFGRRKGIVGFIVDMSDRSDVDPKRIKEIKAVLDDMPILDGERLELAFFLSYQQIFPLGEVIASLLPPAFLRPKPQAPPFARAYRLTQEGRTTDAQTLRRAPKQRLMLKLLQRLGSPATKDEIARHIPSPESAIASLLKKGLIEATRVPRSVSLLPLDEFLQSPPDALTTAQQSAWEKISRAIEGREPKKFLMFGVTGSGKTELYLKAAELALERERSAIFLVPEIALTPQLEGRVAGRLGAPAVLHSGISDNKRAAFFWELLLGRKRAVLGARSALFAPTKNLGLIVIDEEHEPSYKQEDGMRYHAREVAELRAQKTNAVLLLGSATPSVETFYRAETGELELLELPERIEKRPMPTVEIVDLTAESKRPTGYGTLLSLPLITGLEDAIASNQQAILFLNRRGFAPFVVCRACGYVFRCDRCSVAMTYHKFNNSLLCHYCSLSLPFPTHCPKCGRSSFEMPQVGTEVLEIELKRILGKHARVGRLDRDAASSRKAHAEILSAFARGDTNILVGTQMVAKGHDFPEVTFIGVVLADISLNLPDFRAAERTFQLLTQVAGRAGRGSQKGKVIVQTYEPNHYAIQSAVKQDYREFFNKEIEFRRELNYPPFSNLGLVRISTKDRRFARRAAKIIARHIGKEAEGRDDVEILGPSPCPISRLRERYRWQMLIKSKGDVVTWLRAALESPIGKRPHDFRLELDGSPVDFM